MRRRSFLSFIAIAVACLTAVFLNIHQIQSIALLWIAKARDFSASRWRPSRTLLSSPTDAAIAATVRAHVSHISNIFTLVLACGSPFYAVFNTTSASISEWKLQRYGPDSEVIELGRKLEKLVKIADDRGSWIGAELKLFTKSLTPGGELMYRIQESVRKLELVQEGRQRLANPNLGTAQERATLRGSTNALLKTVLPDLCWQLMAYMAYLLPQISFGVSDFDPAVPLGRALLHDFTAEREAVQQSISVLPWYDSWIINRVVGLETRGGALREKLALLESASKDVFEHAERIVIVHENLKRMHDYIEWYVPYANSTIAGQQTNSIHHRYYESELSHARKLADTLLSKATSTLPWWDDIKVLAYPPHPVQEHPALNGPQDLGKEDFSEVPKLTPSPI